MNWFKITFIASIAILQPLVARAASVCGKTIAGDRIIVSKPADFQGCTQLALENIYGIFMQNLPDYVCVEYEKQATEGSGGWGGSASYDICKLVGVSRFTTAECKENRRLSSNHESCEDCPDGKYASPYAGYHTNNTCSYDSLRPCANENEYMPGLVWVEEMQQWVECPENSLAFPEEFGECVSLPEKPTTCRYCPENYYAYEDQGQVVLCVPCPNNGLQPNVVMEAPTITECMLSPGDYHDETGDFTITDGDCYWTE